MKVKKKKEDQPLFLLIDVIVGDIKIKLQADTKAVCATDDCVNNFFKGHWDWKCKWNSVAVFPAAASFSKLGLVQNLNADMKA